MYNQWHHVPVAQSPLSITISHLRWRFGIKEEDDFRIANPLLCKTSNSGGECITNLQAVHPRCTNPSRLRKFNDNLKKPQDRQDSSPEQLRRQLEGLKTRLVMLSMANTGSQIHTKHPCFSDRKAVYAHHKVIEHHSLTVVRVGKLQLVAVQKYTCRAPLKHQYSRYSHPLTHTTNPKTFYINPKLQHPTSKHTWYVLVPYFGLVSPL